jgi:hypothetical protein
MVALISEEHVISTDRYSVRATKNSCGGWSAVSAETVLTGAGNSLDSVRLEIKDSKSVIPLVGYN